METDCQQLVQTYAGTLYRLAFSYCRNRQDAEDVVQEVFLKYLKQKGTFPDENSRRNWLMKVTVNTCKDLFRAPWRSRCCSLEEAAEPAALMPEESELLSVVLRLPAKYRVAVHLYYYEDYSIAEIAKMVNASESAVRMRLQRARQKLKTELGGLWDGSERTV